MDPPYYQIKRYALMVLCGVSIIMYIIYAACAGKIAEEAKHIINETISHQQGMDKETADAVRDTSEKVVLGVTIAVAILEMLFQLIGFLAAWREHFCLAVTYTVLQVLGLIGAFSQSLSRAAFWGSFVVHLIVTIVCILFVMDLNTIRKARMNAPRY